MGLFIGDALGAAVEFQQPGAFEPVTGYRRGPVHDIAAGDWTDDGSMALALADSLIKLGRLNRIDTFNRWRDWLYVGAYSPAKRCFDIGTQTHAALRHFPGEIETDTNGNGGIMRLSPVATFSAGEVTATVILGGVQAAWTHPGPETRKSARELSRILAQLIKSGSSQNLKFAKSKFRAGFVPNNSGWVVSTLQSALYAVVTTGDFRSAVLKAVNLGGDADTIGAVAGQIAGALYGYQAIPTELISGLSWSAQLLDTAGALYRVKHKGEE